MAKKNKGFTLIELLVSISIIGILMALAIVSFGSAQKKARDTRRQEDMQLLQKAAEQYYMLNSSNYPTTWGVGGTGVGSTWAVSGQTILEAFPSDPKGVGGTAYTHTTQTTSAYCFCAYMEGGLGNSGDNDCDFTAATKKWYCVKNQQ